MLEKQDKKQIRLVNRHWAESVASILLKTVQLSVIDFNSPHLCRCLQDYGSNIHEISFKINYSPELDDHIIAIVKETPRLSSLTLPSMYSNELLKQISKYCVLRTLDISLGSSISDRLHDTRFFHYSLVIYQKLCSFRNGYKSPTSPSQLKSPLMSSGFFDVNLKPLIQLHRVHLSGYTHTGRQLCESLSNQKLQLTHMTLRECPKLSQISITAEFFKNLNYLDLSFSRVETLEMAYILQLIFKKQSAIQSLNLSSVRPDISRAFTVFGVQMLPEIRRLDTTSILSCMSTLKYLNVSYGKNMRFDEMVVIMAAFPGLESVILRGCRKINMQAYAWLIDTCAKLHTLDITDGLASIFQHFLI